MINELENLPNCCRICLQRGSKLKSLYISDEDEETPCDMLQKLTGIELEREVEKCKLPKQICKNCICELNLSYQFREKALRAQAFLEEFWKREAKKDPEENKDNLNEELIYQDDAVESMDILEYSEGSNNELETETEQKMPSLGTNKIVKKSKTRKGRLKSKATSRNIKIESVNESNTLDKPEIRVLCKGGRKPSSISQEDKERIGHICDICGNIFAKRGRLTQHRQRHDTDPKYSCEFCGERFLNREVLRRHMYQHAGKKPYQCNYCSRSFYYESVKKAHEAVHAGHKPYICDYCQKAFAYSHQLKAHKLIHTDIKLYHCQLCNKDFRLQHQLKQHEETKRHQLLLREAKETNNKIDSI